MTGPRIALAALVATIAAASAAAAHSPHGSHGARGPWGGPGGPGAIDFAAIDANGDGSLSREELQARAVERLAVFDLNGDGVLDREELIAAFPGRGGMFAVFSVDPAEAAADRILAMTGATAAGQVSVAALAEEQVNMIFVRLDSSRDDAISEEEAAPQQRDDRRGGPRMEPPRP
ncbi:EF-hand domain-containing protein [Amaricoccus sp.]|uniref:EF-hand domain-containing protein n=1 Tax=Amaricoccus sp. TaxID=1872485 RepID=UPI001B744130|nr:EF-hand domain-containing protein [Amaricoccus sp.]MBP7243480.1 EF-hand domain-containing protein [Amaricoccus sp.]